MQIEITPLNGRPFTIAQMIHGYLRATKQEGSLIDQDWMLDRLENWYGVKIARSVLCYNLRLLVDGGYLTRLTRHRRHPKTGQFEPRVTYYRMTLKLKALFARIAAYFRSIGWQDIITASRKAAQRLAAAEKEAAGEGWTFEQFKGSWRQALGIKT